MVLIFLSEIGSLVHRLRIWLFFREVNFARKILYPGVFQLLDQSKEEKKLFKYFDWLSVFFLKIIYPGVRRRLLVFFIVLHFKILAVSDTASKRSDFCVRVFICPPLCRLFFCRFVCVCIFPFFCVYYSQHFYFCLHNFCLFFCLFIFICCLFCYCCYCCFVTCSLYSSFGRMYTTALLFQSSPGRLSKLDGIART